MSLSFRLVKSLDICFLTFWYALFCGVSSFIIDRCFCCDYNKESFPVLLFFIIIQITFTSLVFYLIRNIVHSIRSPFHRWKGFDHYRVKEVDGGVIAGFMLFLLCPMLWNRVSELRKRLEILFPIN